MPRTSKRAEAGEGGEEDAASTLAQARAEAAEREARRSPFRDLFDRGATILVVFTSLDMLASKWGLPLAGSGSLIGSFVEVLLVMFLGYMAYEAVKIVIDREIAKEAPAEKDEEAEVGGTGESRISTLLPIFRNFLLITIVVIATMVILSQLGVNIAPLFAGAGVVGLAVGFGAQTLIRDIFSGAFYLIDDAFRKGEYIDIGSAKGVVEKISIRSMQLRHHRGALTTVPFGEIQKVENFSRDWAVMKLAFRVTYDTDVDKMRKIIKNFGKELLEDEYYGPMFLAPLKSQASCRWKTVHDRACQVHHQAWQAVRASQGRLCRFARSVRKERDPLCTSPGDRACCRDRRRRRGNAACCQRSCCRRGCCGWTIGRRGRWGRPRGSGRPALGYGRY